MTAYISFPLFGDSVPWPAILVRLCSSDKVVHKYVVGIVSFLENKQRTKPSQIDRNSVITISKIINGII